MIDFLYHVEISRHSRDHGMDSPIPTRVKRMKYINGSPIAISVFFKTNYAAVSSLSMAVVDVQLLNGVGLYFRLCNSRST
jgi:hypothetical protein